MKILFIMEKSDSGGAEAGVESAAVGGPVNTAAAASSAPSGADTLSSGQANASESTAQHEAAPVPSAVSAPIHSDASAANSEEKKEKTSKPSFVLATNDNTPQNLVWLTNLKLVFAKQLPKMPETYITRLVFDKNHMSLVCVRDGKSWEEFVSGLTYSSASQK